MSDKLMLDVGQANELKLAFRREGNWTNGDIKILCERKGLLTQVLQIVHGHGEIIPIKHIIDLNKRPRLPFDTAALAKHEREINGESIIEIKLCSDDNLYINGDQIVLNLSEQQMGHRIVVGYQLLEELECSKGVLLSSCILDYIYDHPELFPEYWKKDEDGRIQKIYFWGSIFYRPGFIDYKCVQYLYWHNSVLNRGCHWTHETFDSHCLSASISS